MVPDCIAAIDVGGTKITALVAAEAGPLARLVEPTVKTGSNRAIAEQALAMLSKVCDHAGVATARIGALGVSACGPFVMQDGAIALVPPNLCGGAQHSADLPNDWRVIPFEKILRERFAEVVVRNDCVCALVAERSFGAAQGESDCVYATWSTGIGFGLCVDGQILLGKNGNAGHAGHMLVGEEIDALCGCGNRGDVEGMISGRNLGNRFGQSAPLLFAEALADAPQARAAVQHAASVFGRALYNLAVTLDSRVFVIGGSVWLHHGHWLLPLVDREIVTRMPALTHGVEIRTAALGELASDLGALALVMPPAWQAAWRAQRPWQGLLP